jgi:heterodisulfide reductase subunit A-like polyferredoxin
MELGEPDESGRRRPVPIKGKTFTVEADLIVPAISQEANLDLLPENLPFKKSSWGTLEADSVSLMTDVEGVFAAGDLVLGPDTVIGAIAHGHRAAKAAHAWLEGRPIKDETLRPIEVGVQPPLPAERKRAIQPELPVEKRGGFDEVELGFAQDLAVREAERCLRCGPCDECQTCADECRYRIGLLSFEDSGHNVPLFIRIPENDEQFPLPLKPEPVALEWRTRHEGKKVIERLGMKISSLVCQVNEKLCRGCEDCLKGCDYEAILMEPRGEGVQVARVLADRCKGCGNCVPLCPTQAMVPGYFRNDFVRHEIDALLRESAEVKS